MNFDLSDEQKMLAEQARGLLGERTPYDHLRTLIEHGVESDEPLWRELAGLGFLGANIPEEFGGLGLTELDLGVISEELGWANAAVPFCSSIVLAADAIRLGGSDVQKAQWLPKLASGEAVACMAYAEGPGAVFGEGAAFDGGRLCGVKTPVADAGVASIAVVALRRLGPRQPSHQGGAGWRHVGRQRSEGLVELGALRRLGHSRGAHRPHSPQA